MKEKIVLLPLSIHFLGGTYETKALKCMYSRGNVLYKVALPSVISPISQCWFARDRSSWMPVMGECSAPELLGAVLVALQALDSASQKPSKSQQDRLTYA